MSMSKPLKVRHGWLRSHLQDQPLNLHVNIKQVHNNDEEKNFDDKKDDCVDDLGQETLVQRADHELVSSVCSDDFFCASWVEPSVGWNILQVVRLWNWIGGAAWHAAGIELTHEWEEGHGSDSILKIGPFLKQLERFHKVTWGVT